ncbi:FkbM family methyltransferase [Candidatus Pseudothioglobus singularis]|jgi:FkbM family methyltransferase|nr:FkbM family methyltransferase [Candidatus Pseudothioglobus singularis]
MKIKLIKKITDKIKDIYILLYLSINNRILFTDKYGLSYYLYKNTRPIDTFRRGVRTDDTSVLETVSKIIEDNLHHKNINCIDVGAFIGVVTLMMANTLQKSNNNWTIHSFEPFKKTFSRLKDNIDITFKNHNIELNNVGLSNKSGKQKMHFSADSPGSNKLILASSENQNDTDEVEIITLFEYLTQKSITNILLCKIDAEGVDDLVMKGMKSYIENQKVDYFILEYEDKLSQDKISEILKKYNYKIYFMVRNKNFLVERIDDYPKNEQSLINILAVSPLANMAPVEKLLK